MTYKLRYNKSSVHIEGFETRTTGGGVDTGKGYVSYYALSHCPALTRGAVRMGYVVMGVRNPETREVERVSEWDTVEGVLAAFDTYARVHNAKPCQKCREAAEAQIS